MHKRNSILIAGILAIAASSALGADATELPGKLDAVTVYRGQALVTRLVDVAGPAGLREIIVSNLPEQVLPGSLFAESAADVEVRSVRFRTRPVSQDVREDVRKLEAQIREVTDTQSANTRQRQLVGERKSYLDKLEQFTAPTANAELTRGVLNAETLKMLTVFLFEQRQAIATEDLKLATEGRDIQDKLNLLQRELNNLNAGASKSVREAVVFANFQKAGGQLRLKYMVDSATWSPSYIARAQTGQRAGQRNVTVQYNASIQQMSGEDWSDVTMTLSTATPSLVATAPMLNPLTISLAALTSQPGQPPQASYDLQKKAIADQRQQIEGNRANLRNYSTPGQSGQGGQQFGGAGGGSGNGVPPNFNGINVQNDDELNSLAGKLQVLELLDKDAGRAKSGTRRASIPDQEGVSVTYQLPSRTSLPSRSDQQSIQIATATMVGDFYKLAMPVLTAYVYDQATVVNAGKSVLLAGPVASYLDDQYVGIADLPTVAIGEQFTLGFGIDSSLRASRELLEKTESTQGGNRLMNFSYRLIVENFGPTPATVRLLDRLPMSDDQDIRVTLVSTAKPPTTQPLGPETAASSQHRASILNWSIEVPAQAMGEKAVSMNYQYKLEFDKQMSIAGLAARK